MSAVALCGVFNSMVLGTTLVRHSLLSVIDNFAAPRDFRNATMLGSDRETTHKHMTTIILATKTSESLPENTAG